MAPLESRYAPSAAARAAFLVELCGRRAFFSVDRLIEAEIFVLANPMSEPARVLSENGDWFPTLDDSFLPVKRSDTYRELNGAIDDSGGNRQQRRTLKRQLFKASHPKPLLKGWMANQAENGDLTDLLRMYPMRPTDARVLGRYVLGHATHIEAENAFLESLRDPQWMMQWFGAHHDKLTPITEWLRRPSKALTASMKEMASEARSLRQLVAIPGNSSQAKSLTKNWWNTAQDQLVINVSNRLLSQFHPDTATVCEVSAVDANCPGLSTFIRSLHSAVWDSVNEQPRVPKDSDVVDAIHAMYAPYTSVFRADRYMAPHIQKQVERRGVRVVSQLDTLPEQIKRSLSSIA